MQCKNKIQHREKKICNQSCTFFVKRIKLNFFNLKSNYFVALSNCFELVLACAQEDTIMDELKFCQSVTAVLILNLAYFSYMHQKSISGLNNNLHANVAVVRKERESLLCCIIWQLHFLLNGGQVFLFTLIKLLTGWFLRHHTKCVHKYQIYINYENEK